MGTVWPFGVLVVPVVVLIVVPGSRRWKFAASPFLVPLWFLILAVVDQATTDKDACYEACGYVWTYVFAIATLVPATIATAVILLAGRWIRRRRSACNPASDSATLPQ